MERRSNLFYAPASAFKKYSVVKVFELPASDYVEVVKFKKGIFQKGIEKHNSMKDLLGVYSCYFKGDFTTPSASLIRDRSDNIDPETYARLLKERTLRRAVRESQLSVLANQWDYWCTFTYADKKIRYDRDSCFKLFAKTVKFINRKYSANLQYIVFPEQHKDGAWHLHGFVKGVPQELFFYNKNGCLDIKYFCDIGYVSAENVRNCSSDTVRRKKNYAMKYCLKSLNSFEKYQHLYYKSHDLEKPVVSEFVLDSYEQFHAYQVLDNMLSSSDFWENDYVIKATYSLSEYYNNIEKETQTYGSRWISQENFQE